VRFNPYIKLNSWLKNAQNRVLERLGINFIGEHYYYERVMSSKSNVIDLGANEGLFSKAISEAHHCRIIMVEPNKRLLSEVQIPKSTVLNAVVSTENKCFDFFISENPEASSLDRNYAEKFGLLSVSKLPGVTLEKILKKFDFTVVDLLKVDIEGAEIDLLLNSDDAVLKIFKQITVEFHDFIEPSQIDSIKSIKKRLSQLGFYVIKTSTIYHGSVLFIRKDVFEFDTIGLLQFRAIHLALFTYDFMYFKILLHFRQFIRSFKLLKLNY